MLIEKLLFIFVFCIAFFETRAQTITKAENLPKHLKPSDFNCTKDELQEFISNIETVEAVNGTLLTLDEFIKTGYHIWKLIGENIFLTVNDTIVNSTAGGPAVSVEMTRDDLDVVFSYHFNPNTERVPRQCATLKAYKLKFDKMVEKYRKMKRVLERPYFKKNKVSDELFFRGYDNKKVWRMNPNVRVCTKKLFFHPISKQKLEKIPLVETSFMRSFWTIGDGSGWTDEERGKFERLIIDCIYKDDHEKFSKRAYKVSGGNKVYVLDQTDLTIHSKKHK